MAQAILSSLLDVIFGNLGSASLQEHQQVWGLDAGQEPQNLKSTLSSIQAVLDDAEERQFESMAVQDWLQNLKDVAYDAYDSVDEIVAEAQQSKTAETGKKMKRVWDSFSSLLNSSQRDMACRIRHINMRLDKIAKEKRDFHFETRCGNRPMDVRDQPRLVSSVRDESSQVLGREDDIEQIKKSVLSDDSGERKFSVIPIVGMGAVGKTTMSQVVYNNKRVTDNFELRAWVCVSEHFDVRRLTRETIASATKTTGDLFDIDSLQCHHGNELNGKKFLLVLDDAWNENSTNWERLQAPSTFGSKGS